MCERMTVKILRPYPPFQPGDVTAFTPAQAASLCRRGVACLASADLAEAWAKRQPAAETMAVRDGEGG